jgi:hypothetical protein
MRFFDPETKPQKFGHRWGKINSYDFPEKLFPAGTQRQTYLLPSSSIGGWLVGCGSPFLCYIGDLRAKNRWPGRLSSQAIILWPSGQSSGLLFCPIENPRELMNTGFAAVYSSGNASSGM